MCLTKVTTFLTLFVLAMISPFHYAQGQVGPYRADTQSVIAIPLKTLGENSTVAMGLDVMHSKGTPYVELRYYGQRWRHWSAYLGTTISENNTDSTFYPRVGAELYKAWLHHHWITGIGMALARSDNIVGTPMRYQLRLARIFKSGSSVELLHESNCQSLCDNSLMSWIPHGKCGPNHGYNFILYRIPLR